VRRGGNRTPLRRSFLLSITFRLIYKLNLSTVEEKRMSDVTEKMAHLGQLRKAALVAIVIPAALLVGCAPQPAPPPPPQPVYTPAPPPAPPAVPYVRG
jgi:hypothetical protein